MSGGGGGSRTGTVGLGPFWDEPVVPLVVPVLVEVTVLPEGSVKGLDRWTRDSE